MNSSVVYLLFIERSLYFLFAPFLEKGFVKDYDLEKHISVHNSHRPFMCGHCGDAFKSEVRLKEHGILLHGQGTEEQR